MRIEGDTLKENVEDYVILFKNNGRSLNYVRIIIFAIPSFCDSNDKTGINWKKIHKLLDKKQRSQKSRPYTADEIKRMLNATKDLLNKALISFLAASGVCSGAIPELQMKHLKQITGDCLAVTVYEGTNEEYITFVHKEVSDALKIYFKQREHDGEKLEPEHPVFRAKYQLGIAKARPFSENGMKTRIPLMIL